MTDPLLRLRQRWLPIFQQHAIQKAIVFGSWARGEPSRRSDIDLLLVQLSDKRFLDRYDGLLLALARAVPERDIEVLIYTPEELDAIKHRPLIASALQEGKIIYESEQEPTRS